MAVVNPKSEVSTRRHRITPGAIPRRIPVSGEIPGYHLHVVNDSPGNIVELQNRGYEFVDRSDATIHKLIVPEAESRNTDFGDKIRFYVGVNELNQPLYAYLMKIRQEWYDEDCDALNAASREYLSSPPQRESGYVAREGIHITQE